ncbi:MAG: hypothetical protein FJZ87_14170 [Chloroflexi bacterium]|nr:hypothetical protein [Chloroflexota bacterium]
MNLFRKLFGGSFAEPENRLYLFKVKCLRCGEIIEGRIDLYHDLSVEYEQGGDVYHARKILMGGSTCFQRIETAFKFNASRILVDRVVSGGEFAG